MVYVYKTLRDGVDIMSLINETYLRLDNAFSFGRGYLPSNPVQVLILGDAVVAERSSRLFSNDGV